MINVFQPSLGKEEIAAIRKVFKSNWLGKGPITDQFEESFAKHIRVDKDLVNSINSCTEGLFQSMEVLNITTGDEVVLPTVSFVGAANAIVKSGARPVFCDVDPRTLNPTAEMIAEKITLRTRAIMVIHYGGYPCDMDGIMELAEDRGVNVIEDCACAVATQYKSKPVGTIGHIGIWSFDSMKTMVTCDGGMMWCRRKEHADWLKRNINFGMDFSSGMSKSESVDRNWWEFDVQQAGRRAIINDLTATLGLVQLGKLPKIVEWRNLVHNSYNVELADTGLVLPPILPDDCKATYYLYWVQLDKRDELAQYLRKKGIYSTFRYYPLHKVKYYNAWADLPNAEKAAKTTLCIPIHQSLSLEDVEYICDTIKEFMNNGHSDG